VREEKRKQRCIGSEERLCIFRRQSPPLLVFIILLALLCCCDNAIEHGYIVIKMRRCALAVLARWIFRSDMLTAVVKKVLKKAFFGF
jgi:hypothetical protein